MPWLQLQIPADPDTADQLEDLLLEMGADAVIEMDADWSHDPRYIPRRTRLFIPETVGMRMPDGTLHDGYWYASDTGGAIKGANRFLQIGGAVRAHDWGCYRVLL